MDRLEERLEIAAKAYATLCEVLNVDVPPTVRRGRVSGTSEKVVPGNSYVVAYALADSPAGGGSLTVLRIIHGAHDGREDRRPDA